MMSGKIRLSDYRVRRSGAAYLPLVAGACDIAYAYGSNAE
jgi:hypothetical protein